MYLVNNIPLEDFVECGTSDDIRQGSDFNNYFKGSGKKFISIAKDFDYCKPYDKYLYDNQYLLAMKGTRPNTNIRADIQSPGQYYLVKFTDKEVWILDKEIAYNDIKTERTGTRIGTAKEDLKYVFLGLFGAGGGASGGNSLVNHQGRGGASGGVVFGLLELNHKAIDGVCRHNSLPLQCGKGGDGCYEINTAQSGKYTGLLVNNELPCMYASGGNGANGESQGVGTESVVRSIPFFTTINTCKGANGGQNGNNGESVPLTETQQYAPQGEDGYIIYGGYHSYAQSWASAGGSGPLGKGGNAYGGNGDNGENADITGGGGGGNYKTFSTSKGGNGGHGCIRIYY